MADIMWLARTTLFRTAESPSCFGMSFTFLAGFILSGPRLRKAAQCDSLINRGLTLVVIVVVVICGVFLAVVVAAVVVLGRHRIETAKVLWCGLAEEGSTQDRVCQQTKIPLASVGAELGG